MRSNNIGDPFDSLTCADVQYTEQPIDVYGAMRDSLDLENEDLFTSTESRYTDYFCTKIVVNSAATIGEVSRVELYQHRNNPRRGFAIVYQILRNIHAKLVVQNRFISNDPEYRARHLGRMTERLQSATREEIQRFLS